MSSAIDLWNIVENFRPEILNNFSWEKQMLKTLIPVNLMPIKFKELLTQKFHMDFCLIKFYLYALFLTTIFTDLLFFMVENWEVSSFIVMDLW